MKTYLIELLKNLGFEPSFIIIATSIVFIILLTAIAIHIFLHKIVLKSIKKVHLKKRTLLTSSLIEENIFQRVALVFQGVIVYWQSHIWLQNGVAYEIFSSFSIVWIAIFGLLLAYSLIDKFFNSIYEATGVDIFSMQGINQSIKLLVGMIIAIYAIAILIDKSPIAILSGFGAMSAVLMLIFKDTILGFSAGLQITTSKIVQIGDWIEMPKYGINGDVIEIGLNILRVQNFDKTIVSIPTYALVSDSFKNYRGMRDSGARRIKRSILIDINSIKFLNSDDIDRLKKIELIKEYLDKKIDEINEHNKKYESNQSLVINGRRLTNIGTLRAYLVEYLKNNPNISQDTTLMVRQLEPTHFGVPLELYCFTNTTQWLSYEDIQSDIFDHLFAIISEFGLRINQISSYEGAITSR